MRESKPEGSGLLAQAWASGKGTARGFARDGTPSRAGRDFALGAVFETASDPHLYWVSLKVSGATVH